MDRENINIAIIGMGYVGLPLAIEFGKVFRTFGYDSNKSRISDLINGLDSTMEIESKEFNNLQDLNFTSNIADIQNCNIYIICVPTPIDEQKNPDLNMVLSASSSIGKLIKKNDIVIYESTVYPGVTEEICVPILEKSSGLIFNEDFFCGYSPERINPGDKLHRLTSIVKVTSGSTPEIAEKIDKLYKNIISAGTFQAKSIKVAEAAKVIENTQRDVNIALINELSIIFNKLGIDTEAVLDAAGTKWNFIDFRPGLVGGHCIGVDPYYLTHKAIKHGYYPEIILAGRKINDNMGIYVVDQVINIMHQKKIVSIDAKILIMGFTFKENCPDIRNTKVIDVVKGFRDRKCEVDIFDPWVNSEEAYSEYGVKTINKPYKEKYDAVIVAVSHMEFKSYTKQMIKSFCKDNFVIYDIKYILSEGEVDGRL